MGDKPTPPPEMLLGRATPLIESYAPQLLYPISREPARAALGFSAGLPFYGADLWHAYELSWLDSSRRPVARVGRFSFPCTSPSLVESKSFKLYLNSLNNAVFESDSAAVECITTDLARVTGAVPELQLLLPDDVTLQGIPLEGKCIDSSELPSTSGEPQAAQLKIVPGRGVVEEQLYSHLLRSLCPVTGQPDWATVWLHYRGQALDHSSLLGYVVSYRRHQEFHEQCVERMFRDLCSRCEPEFLHIQALYTRRGGLDISPFRSTTKVRPPLRRLNRQ